jgi:hypothetical protein
MLYSYFSLTLTLGCNKLERLYVPSIFSMTKTKQGRGIYLSVGRLLDLATNIRLGRKYLRRKKHSSLLCQTVNAVKKV